MTKPTTRIRRLLARRAVAGTALVIALAIIGAIAGAVIGAAGSAYSASAEVLAQPTATLENSDPTPTTQDANDLFLGSQVESVSSLTEDLPGGATVTVSQIGLTSVLQITATATTKKDAVAAGNTVLDRYVALRTKQVSDYAANATRRIQRQLDEDATQLAAASASTAARAAQQTALSADYSRLVGQLRSVQLTAQTAQPTSVVHRARTADAASTSNAVRNAILGLLLGVLLGVGLVAADRRSPRTSRRSVETAASLPADPPAERPLKTASTPAKTAVGRR